MHTDHKRRELQRRNKPTTYHSHTPNGELVCLLNGTVIFWKPILSQDISAQGYLLCSRETQVASGKMVLHLYGLRTHCLQLATV